MRRRAFYQNRITKHYLDVEPKYIWVSQIDFANVDVYSNTDWWIE